MGRGKIIGLGVAKGPKLITNKDLSKVPFIKKVKDEQGQVTEETSYLSEAEIFSRTGMVNRWMANDDQVSSDLAAIASREAIADAGIDASQIEQIVFVTSTPDKVIPSSAHRLQLLLEARNVRNAYDYIQGCSGTVTVLEQFISYDGRLNNGDRGYALVVGAETLRRYLEPDDKNTQILFSDGAAAMIIGRSDDDSGIQGVWAASDPFNGKYDLIRKIDYHGPIKVDGRPVLKEATRSMVQACQSILEKMELSEADIKLKIPHQANDRITVGIKKRSPAPEKIYSVIEEIGNMSGVTCIYAYKRARDDKFIIPGDLVMLLTYGSGTQWAAAIYKH